MSRALLRALCAVIGPVVLAACWPMPGADPGRTSFNGVEKTLSPLTVQNLTEKWRWTSPHGSVASPVVSTGGVHVTGECWLTTLAASSGAERWSQRIVDSDLACGPGQTSTGEPYVVGSDVLAGVFWSYLTPPGSLQTAAVTPHFDVTSGQRGVEDNLFLVAQRGPTSARSSVAASSPGAGAFSLGVGTWAITVWGAPDPGAPITSVTLGTDKLFHAGYGVMDTSPTGGPGTAHFGDGVRAYAIGQDHGGCGPVFWTSPQPGGVFVECPAWVSPTDGSPTIPVLSPDGTTVFVRTSAGTLYVLDAATGAILWTASGLGDGGKPALAGDTVWVPTGTGQVLPFAAGGCGAATCGPSLPWHVDTGTGQPVSAVTVANDVVYATSNGSIYAAGGCNSGACPVEWSGPGTGPAVISSGQLYVTSGASTVIAYGLS
jgi:outer membrane protein assembly factor BamB